MAVLYLEENHFLAIPNKLKHLFFFGQLLIFVLSFHNISRVTIFSTG